MNSLTKTTVLRQDYLLCHYLSTEQVWKTVYYRRFSTKMLLIRKELSTVSLKSVLKLFQ